MKLCPWPLVALLFLTASASYLCRTNISVVGALMMRDLGLAQIEMGALFSAFVLGYALFQVPAGLVADRWGARKVLGWSAFCWVVVTGCMAALGLGILGSASISALTILLVLRFVLGVGEAPTFPAAAQGVSQWVPSSGLGFANGFVLAAIGAGSATAPVLLSRVMVLWGWRVALLTSAVPAMAVALVWKSVPEPRGSSVSLVPTLSPRKDGRRLWSLSFVLLTISYTLEGYVSYIFVFWFYLYLVQVRHFNLLQAGNLSSLPWLLSMVSIPSGGFISDRLVKGALGRRWGRRAIPMTGLTLSGVFLALGAETRSAPFAVGYLTLATALVLCVEGPFWATMLELAGPRSGTAGGVMNFGSNIGGLISPALTPILAAHLGWENALYVGAGSAIVGAALWLGISPHALSESQS
jgi:ACS family glucarate transporter-like MFS transporter